MKKQYIRSIELLENDSINWSRYPHNLDAVKHLKELDFHENVTFFSWENGSGKSTILEAIAVQYWFNPEGWSKNFNFSSKETHSQLETNIRIAKWISLPKDWYFLRAESFYNLASNIDDLDEEMSFWPPLIDSYWWTSLHEQSHWESFFSLFMERLWWNGIYIFDEPEAALSPEKQLALLSRIHELVIQKSQFIIATHSPILLSYPNAKIIEINSKGYHDISYKESQNYNVYKSFIDNPERIIEQLWIEKFT